MFLFLNRVAKALVCAVWLTAAWFGWQQRERLLPAWDFVQLWVERDSSAVTEIVRLTGTATDVTSETSFHLRESDGRIWHCGLVGLNGVHPTNRVATAPELALARDTRTNLNASLAGRPVVFEATVTTPLRAAMGVVRSHGTNLNLTLLGEGRARLDRAQIHALPLMDQYDLVAAERRARKTQRGLWGLDAVPNGADTPR